jgi:hypothetical protein
MGGKSWQNKYTIPVRYTFLATSVFPPLGIQKVQSQSSNNYIQKKFVNTVKQQSSKKVNSGLLLLFLLKYKQFTDKNKQISTGSLA